MSAFRFKENPKGHCGFATVNGTVDVRCSRNGLSPTFRLKTFNGEVYADFDLAGLPHESMTPQHEGRRMIYGGADYYLVRAGDGGPDSEFETLTAISHSQKSR